MDNVEADQESKKHIRLAGWMLNRSLHPGTISSSRDIQTRPRSRSDRCLSSIIRGSRPLCIPTIRSSLRQERVQSVVVIAPVWHAGSIVASQYYYVGEHSRPIPVPLSHSPHVLVNPMRQIHPLVRNNGLKSRV